MDADSVEPKEFRKLTEKEQQLFAPVIARWMGLKLQLAETEAELGRLCSAVEPHFEDEHLIFNPQTRTFYHPHIFTVKNS